MKYKQRERQSLFRCGLTIAAVLSLAGVSLSAPVDNPPEAFSLGEVVVTAKGGGVEATQTVHEVTAADIKARNARTLNEAIELLPGLNVRSGGEGVPRIDIRGLRTRHVVLLLDGIPMNSALDQQFNPVAIPVENIAKIKLTVGPSSVLYGQGGLAGVINIITKKGVPGVKGSIAMEVGDHQAYLGRATMSASKDKLDFFLSGSIYDQDSFPLSGDFNRTSLQGKDYRANSDITRKNVFASAGYQATPDLNLALTLNYLNGGFGKPSSVISNVWSNSNPGGDVFASNPKFERVEDYESFSLQLAGDYAPKGPFSLRTWAFINRMDEHSKGFDNNSYTTITRNNSYDVTARSDIKGITMQPRYDFGRGGILTAGFSVEGDSWDNRGFTIGRVGTRNNQRINANFEHDFNIYSLTAQYELEPVENLGLVVGYGHFLQDRDEMSDDDFSVQAGIHYDFPTGTRAKAAFQRNIRFPSLQQLYDVSGGNSNLQTERSYQYEIGVEQKLPGNCLVTLTGFRTDAKNFIEKDSNSVYQNFQKYRFYGFEVAAETRFFKDLVLRASYSYLDSKDKSANATKDELQYRPKNKVGFEGWYDFAFGLTPYVSVQYIADQVTYDRPTESVTYRMKDYTLVNVKLSQKVIKNYLDVYIGVNNIFDENYETSYGFPQAGRFIYGGIQVNL